MRGSILSEMRPASGEDRHDQGLRQHDETGIPGAHALQVLQVEAQEEGEGIRGRVVDERRDVREGKDGVARNSLSSKTGEKGLLSRKMNPPSTATPAISSQRRWQGSGGSRT